MKHVVYKVEDTSYKKGGARHPRKKVSAILIRAGKPVELGSIEDTYCDAPQLLLTLLVEKKVINEIIYRTCTSLWELEHTYQVHCVQL